MSAKAKQQRLMFILAAVFLVALIISGAVFVGLRQTILNVQSGATWTLIIDPATVGTTNPSSGTYTYPVSDVVQITANPSSNLQCWLQDGAGPTNCGQAQISVQGKTGETHHIQAIWVDTVTINGKQYVRTPHALIPAVEWNWFQAHANEIAAGTIVMSVSLVLIGLPVLMPLDTVLLTSEIPSDTVGWSETAPQNVLSKEIEITKEGDFWSFEIPPQTASKPVPIDPSTRLPVGVDPFDVVGKDASGNSLTWADLQRWLVTRSRQLGGPPPPTIGADELTPGVAVPIWFIHASTTVQTTQTTAQTTTTVSGPPTIRFQNGGFESGSLAPWHIIGSGGQVTISTQQVESGSYSASITASPNDLMGIQQDFALISPPFNFSAYFYNVQYPTACNHPYTQFSIVDTAGRAVEAGFDAGGMAWATWWRTSADYRTTLASWKAPNHWVHLSVEVYSDHFNFYVDRQAYMNIGQGSGFVFSDTHTVQIFGSCSAVAYVDDVVFVPISVSVLAPVVEAWDRFWAWVWCQFNSSYCS